MAEKQTVTVRDEKRKKKSKADSFRENRCAERQMIVQFKTD